MTGASSLKILLLLLLLLLLLFTLSCSTVHSLYPSLYFVFQFTVYSVLLFFVLCFHLRFTLCSPLFNVIVIPSLYPFVSFVLPCVTSFTLCFYSLFFVFPSFALRSFIFTLLSPSFSHVFAFVLPCVLLPFSPVLLLFTMCAPSFYCVLNTGGNSGWLRGVKRLHVFSIWWTQLNCLMRMPTAYKPLTNK